MKGILLLITYCFISITTFSQITITSSDMPVSGDTLRYSTVLGITSGINVYDSGTNKTWVYDTLRAVIQGRDDYKSALAVNPAYGLISLSAYGYKVADSIPGIGSLVPGLSIKEVYTFFSKKSSPNRYVAEGFGAKISGAPIPAAYADEDEIYYFPLTYPHATDSSSFNVNVSLPTLGNYKRSGYRKTRVDGWGTIKTPYYTTAVNCIRVRSEIHEIDTINITTPITFNFPIVMDTVEYKWLVSGEHYPALWVTQSKHTSAITSVTYRDSVRHGIVSVKNISPLSLQEIKAYPNPAKDIVTIDIPVAWNNYTITVYDIAGKILTAYKDTKEINIRSLTSGRYFLLIKSDDQLGYTQVIKQ